ncbi:MAG: ATP-dependent metallopeptidase FtsH/Yme1/Tma family protein [Proteobacteria bacterium]|nr:ATP-dependent metallopeptidase FtsH/Yme1/Tma family protein [Pseudomonadota bacterium]
MILFFTLAIYSLLLGVTDDSNKISYTEFVSQVKEKKVAEADISGTEITATLVDGSKIKTTSTSVYNPDLVKDLLANNVNIKVKKEQGTSLGTILISWFPTLLLIGVWIFFMRQMGGGSGGGKANPLGFGRSKAQMIAPEDIEVRFKDVAGCDEAKQELEEMVEYLKNPSKFQNLGGKIPKGALLTGDPGTGKTLLAKAVAGEANVPFFSISGSDFVEMFVGVGAARVRDLFAQAKEKAPCIIFIDEIDAVGRHRGAGIGGGNDEREQTLNQMLVEMDGFKPNQSIIVLAATNRPDVLDTALMRPGRFDRQIIVPLPDIKGREHILNVHIKIIPVSNDVDSQVIARGTPGFSGADLANLVNEAALMAARNNKKLVDMSDFEKAKEKIMMGAERKSNALTEDQRKTTAYHEGGHAIIAVEIEGESDPLHKVTIMPRGRALGVTMQLPEEDKVTYSKEYLENQIAILMGGRLAEELILNQQTTGAGNDIERATSLARRMVCNWGMSDLGPLTYDNASNGPVFGQPGSSNKSAVISEKLAEQIDSEIKKIVEKNYGRAKDILKSNEENLHSLAEALLEYETLDKEQIDDLFAGKPIILKEDYTQTKRTRDRASGEVKEEPSEDNKTKAKKAKPAKKTKAKSKADVKAKGSKPKTKTTKK